MAARERRSVRARRTRTGTLAEGAVRPHWHHQPRAVDGGRVSGGFRGPDLPALADLQNCIHCGFCLPVCPTYIATGQELESPRGRLHLVRAVLDGKAEATDRLLSHLDLCLQCRACESACPSQVPYGRIMEDARAATMARGARDRPRAWTLRALALRYVLARPRVLRSVLALARLYTRSGLQRLVRGPLARALPAPLRALEAQAPVLDRAPFRRSGVLARPQAMRARVALLTGCVHGELYPQMHEATVSVLTRLGCEVVAPPAQVCCGALHTHAGDAETARALARRNIAAFEAAGVDAVIVNAAGCSAAMKEYGRLLRSDARWALRAERFASGVRDVLEYVAAQDFAAPGLGAVPGDVTLQDACHLAHAQRIRSAPRAILGAIPGLRLREMQTPDRCCGAAGLYALVQGEMSRTVLASKMAEIAATGAHLIATANPGCTLQLEAGVRRSGLDAGVRHVIELLDESYRAAAAARG
ncbi:MAG: 4Fe-4S dicluster domain-containing protein [Dehalococcoidia bacterium]|nr:4Fe-4S dicluster domain-containing protein [Dehalococcoidia bacterium]